MKRTSLLSVLALAVALPAFSLATTPGETFVTNWDYDGDGQVTLSEVLERRADLFASFDENGDGVLSPTELAAHNAAAVSMREANGAPLGMGPGGGLGRGFGNGPGGGRGQALASQQGFGRGPGAGGGMMRGMRGQAPMQVQGQQFAGARLDANHDGTVSQDEFVNMGKAWFARFDRDGDGVVLPTDFPSVARW